MKPKVISTRFESAGNKHKQSYLRHQPGGSFSTTIPGGFGTDRLASYQRGFPWNSQTALLGAAAIFLPLLVTANAAESKEGDGASQKSATVQAATESSATLKKPDWLTDLSVGLRESYDNNAFISGVDPRYLPAYTVPAGSVAALKEQSSWLTTVSPKVGVNFAPLLGDQSVLKALTLGYAPDFVTYHNTPSESYNAHRIATGIKGAADAFSFNLDNGFNYIDGSKYGATYPGSLLNAYGTGTIRERREQFQDRAKITLRYDQEKWFVRPNASLLYYDLLTTQLKAAGYQNYADRYDVNGGLDVGYKINPQLAAVLGYKYGHQYQEQYAWDTSLQSSPSDYNRVLLGLEGKPLKWLKVELAAGPDFRSYEQNEPGVHITPVNDKDPVKYYGEASLAADISPKDAITFKYKQWQWVSSTGKLPYFDSYFDLGYRRKLTEKLSFDLGGRALASDYTSANTASGKRDDWLYTVSSGFKYNFTSNFSADLAYSYDLGRNAQDDVINAETREFDRQIVSLGAQVKF